MAQAVLLPKLGQTTIESTIVKWHKRVGDPVAKGDVLFEMETDKAVLEAESFFEGTLLKIYLQEGETAPVSSVVAYIGQPGETTPDAPPPPPPAETAAAPSARLSVAPAPKAPPAPFGATLSAASLTAPVAPVAPRVAQYVPKLNAPARRLVISPRARALARAAAIDPSPIPGTGPGGRIIEKDVRAHLERHNYDALRITPAAKRLAVIESIDLLSIRGTGDRGRIMVGDVERLIAERPKPMSKMRRIIARRLTDSVVTMPHFYVSLAVDMTALLRFREALKRQGAAPGVTDFINEAVILSLVEFPDVNSRTDGESVQWRGSVNLGVAVSLDSGLVVPVIRNAQELSLTELSDTTRSLVKKARDGKLGPDEMQGGTFTVSNMGMLDVDRFTAIINPGEAAILAVGSAVETAVVRNGAIVARAMMNITLSADHRIIDGALAARFANSIKSKLEDGELWKALTSS